MEILRKDMEEKRSEEESSGRKETNHMLQEQQERLGLELLQNSRNELYRRYPFLNSAVLGLNFEPQWEFPGMGTEGKGFYFHPRILLQQYREDPQRITSGYLHVLFHCLYLHIFPEPGLEKERWDLACDIAAELMVLQERALPEEKTVCLRELQRQIGKKTASAEEWYLFLEQNQFSYSEEELRQLLFFDDHRLWTEAWQKEEREGLRKKWERLGSLMGHGRQGSSYQPGTEAGTVREELRKLQKSTYDYRHFLKRFADWREEAELDLESFDYIAYSYGMEQYENIPFLEPLEYREGQKLEELVIAIDTSGSCSTEMVRQFLQESYAILEEKENFFQKMNVYLIQCDCVIQDVTCIHSREEWEQYAAALEIQGRAGTDFRPVFRYVEQLREQKALKDLRALIYFTDGDGIYPREAPEYETAFVFVRKPTGRSVPSWAKMLVVQQ